MCGGSPRNPSDAGRGPGLSPRVRGKPQWSGTGDMAKRSIPACAGEAGPGAERPASQSVYPRVCGGSVGNIVRLIPMSGLSPRVRGKPIISYSSVGGVRSIPACAGEARSITEAKTSESVYPRVCGGSPAGLLPADSHQGLSPRVRGKHLQAHRRAGSGRSIPACAGEAASSASTSGIVRVYPRVCGGSVEYGSRGESARGLSPRVRGKPGTSGISPSGMGSIPACAGEARRPGPAATTAAVYPRVCGGSPPASAPPVWAAGLSPRVRGKLLDDAWSGDAVGSIPACAGEASVVISQPAAISVYPRVCGGSGVVPGSSTSWQGLSPRVRGKHPAGGRASCRQRSIPACAGEACVRACWDWS